MTSTIIGKIPSLFIVGLFVLILKVNDLMGQNLRPAVDEFSGMYNASSICATDELYGEPSPDVEVLYSSEQAKSALTWDEIKAVGDLVKDYERNVVATQTGDVDFQSRYREGTYFVPGDRTIHLLPGDYSLVTPKFCDGLSRLLEERHPLWRVMVCVQGTQSLPMVYPRLVVIPRSWNGRDEEYWDFIQRTGRESYETAPARLEELQTALVRPLINSGQTEEISSGGIRLRVLAVFERQVTINEVPVDRLDIWIATDNQYPGKCYLPSSRRPGYCGGESMYGIDRFGVMREHSFGDDSNQDEGFKSRIYSLTYDASRFNYRLLLESPETAADFEVLVPADTPRWRQVKGRLAFERVLH
ncbi:MAG: hypothetical protein ACK5D7_09340 [Planctomycetota bacterium]